MFILRQNSNITGALVLLWFLYCCNDGTCSCDIVLFFLINEHYLLRFPTIFCCSSVLLFSLFWNVDGFNFSCSCFNTNIKQHLLVNHNNEIYLFLKRLQLTFNNYFFHLVTYFSFSCSQYIFDFTLVSQPKLGS